MTASLLACAVVALALVALLPAAAAEAVSVPHGCGQPVVASGSHSLTVRCTSGRGTRYKVVADACNTGNCVSVGSSIVSYGTTAKVDGGGGYVTASSVTIYWYSGSTACAYAKLGGSITWCEIYQNIKYWVAQHPYYDQTNYIEGWYQDKTYRTDCSGLVTAAWHMSTNTPNTDSLESSTYTTSIARSSLRAGDILDNVQGAYDNHHVVIFAGWNSDHTSGTNGHFSIWSFGYGTFADDAGHHETHDSFASGSTIAGDPESDYDARRYVHSTG